MGSQYMVTVFIFEWEILSSKCEPKELNQKKSQKKKKQKQKNHTKQAVCQRLKVKFNPYINDGKIVT